MLFQPMAADDVASALGKTVTQTGGLEQFRLDEPMRRDLAARKDPREVISDSHARYFGIKVGERTLLPGDHARLGETRFEDWLSQSTKQLPKTFAAS